MNEKVLEAANVIKSIVALDPIPGSRLSPLLKAQLPDWDPAALGVRNLREFIAAHVPEVVVAGRSGMDVIYALAGTAAEASASGSSGSVDFWRIWVSPKSPYDLAVDGAKATIRGLRRGEKAEAGEVVLVSPAADVHRSIAQTFLTTLPPSIQPKLQAAFESGSKHWWQTWVRDLRGADHLEGWISFRQEQFETQLTDELRAKGLDQSVIDHIMTNVRGNRGTPRPTTDDVKDKPAKWETIDRAALIRLVTAAVQQLSLAELRELRLPVGVVVDLLTPSKSR